MPPLLRALVFGATLAVAVGPIAVLIVQCGLTRGFASAARWGLGAGLADFTYALISFTVGTAIWHSPDSGCAATLPILAGWRGSTSRAAWGSCCSECPG